MALWVIYTALTAICTGGLMLFGMSGFDAINHAFTTLATGGFSTQNASIAAYESPWIHWWLILFMVIASGSFLLYVRWLYRKEGRFKPDEPLGGFLIAMVVSTVLISLARWLSGETGFWHSILGSAFQVASIGSTTGFASENYDKW
ncbi:MAG: potassium transporter TrkG [Verrucomicrobiales bacterium]